MSKAGQTSDFPVVSPSHIQTSKQLTLLVLQCLFRRSSINYVNHGNHVLLSQVKAASPHLNYVYAAVNYKLDSGAGVSIGIDQHLHTHADVSITEEDVAHGRQGCTSQPPPALSPELLLCRRRLCGLGLLLALHYTATS